MNKSSAFAAFGLFGFALTGCYVPQTKKGTGTHQVFNASIDELRAAAHEDADSGNFKMTTTSTPEMIRAVCSAWNIAYAYYFSPGSEVGQTDVEMVCGLLNSAKTRKECERQHLDKIEEYVNHLQLRKGAPASATAAGLAAQSIRSDADEPGFRPKGPWTDDYALIVGVEKYEKLPKADYAERDAQTVKEYMKALGVPEENIVLLTGQRATRTGLAKYVEEWLPHEATSKSRVYFYYSGHGSPDPADGASYLVPWDGDPAFLKTSAYPVTRLYEQLAALKAKQVVVMLDSCFSGAGGRSVIAQGLRPLVNVAAPAVPASAPMAVLSASSADQVTGALDDQGHGLFTYYMLKGLQGEAAVNGHVDLAGLYSYVKKSVTQGARLQNREQTPQLKALDPSVRLY